MKVLLFGAGWIGKQFISNTTHNVIIATVRAEDALDEIQRINPDCVISFLGRTHGPGCSSIDYLEDKLYENMRDNFYAPFNLASICETLNIHFVYLGTGCIYTGGTFTEEDTPNFFGSGYSIVKGYTDKVLRHFKNTLQLRIRMPISKLVSGRNLIDKLVSYPNICSIPNSMTVLDDMWPIIDKMIELKECGVYNLTNPGVIEHDWILREYSKYTPHTWTLISYEDQNIKCGRSNNKMDTTKLELFCDEYGLELLPIKESILRCFCYRFSGLSS